MSRRTIKLLYLFIFTFCFYSETSFAFQSDESHQDMEGYYVDLENDTSFVTLKIPMYLEEPYYTILQYVVKYSEQTGDLQKLKPKTTKSYGFAFNHKLIRMVTIKGQFLRLLDEDEFTLPNPDFKLFIKYTQPYPLIAIATKEPLTKQYFFKQGDSKLTPINGEIGLYKLSESLIERGKIKGQPSECLSR